LIRDTFHQQLNSSEWQNYCDHSVTGADVRLASATDSEREFLRIGQFSAKNCCRLASETEDLRHRLRSMTVPRRPRIALARRGRVDEFLYLPRVLYVLLFIWCVRGGVSDTSPKFRFASQFAIHCLSHLSEQNRLGKLESDLIGSKRLHVLFASTFIHLFSCK